MTILTAVLASLLVAQQGAPEETLTRPPELIEFVPAEYPPEAAASAIEGSVTLAITIGEDGGVQQAVVVDAGPHPGFAAAALHAVQQFRFRPAEIDGKPAAVEIAYRYDFVLRREEPATPTVDAALALEVRVLERGTAVPVWRDRRRGDVTVETGPDGASRCGVRPATSSQIAPRHEPLATERIEAGRVRGRVPPGARRDPPGGGDPASAPAR
jgi:TonB family protein